MEPEPDSDKSKSSPPMDKRLANISLTENAEPATSPVKKEVDDEGERADRDKFMALVKKSRQLAEEGNIARALQLNKRALAIHYSDKLEKRIKKMEAFLTQLDNDSDDDDDHDENKEDMEDLGLGFKLHCSMAGKLYTHQKEGVLWLWTLFRKGKGGILADDMGLGKTIQVIAFLAGMFDMDKIKTVMIVVPLSVMPTWEKEFEKWTPGINVTQFHGSSKKDRERALHKVRSRGGVMLTTYGLIITQKETLAERYGKEFVWDYIILDEGHKIKNKTKTSTGMNAIPAKNRIILTGTPVQNNLKELWSLFDWVHQGSLLGTVRTFKMQFETPIIRARERDASAVDKRLGQEMSDALKTIIQPYFLRRTKKGVAQQGEDDLDENCAKMPELTRKNDLVLWVHLNDMQQKIYRDFLDLDEVKALLMTKKSPLVALTVLKKICDHPRLLPPRACKTLGLDGKDYDEEDLDDSPIDDNESLASKIDNIPDDVLVGEAGKMGILIELLDNFRMEGHKTLVFSQSRKLLDMIQRVITNRGHKVARLDGTVTSLDERKDIVDRFQKNPNYSVFLLTIQVGGVGLTITAADRVIIYDPSWNPAVDAQAVDRAYRIGQTENVVVHRLISCGTVEEKIYRRQVFKDSITRQTTSNSKNPYRYFTQMELRELFTLDDPRFSKTQQQLQEMHANQRVTDESLDMHIAFLHSLDIFGISDHDLMFNETHDRDDEEGDENMFIPHQEHGNNEDFIQLKIQQAQKLIAEESNHTLSYEQRTKGLVRPLENAGVRDTGIGFQPGNTLFTQVSPDTEEDAVAYVERMYGKQGMDVKQLINGQQLVPSIQPIPIEDSDEEKEDIKPIIKHEDVKDIKPIIKHEDHGDQNDFDGGVGDEATQNENPTIKIEPVDKSYGDSVVVIDDDTNDSVSAYADENVSPDADENMSPYADENVSPYSDENASPSADENVSPSADENVSPYADENVSPYADENVSPYADENVSPCADENVSPYADENVSPYADENVSPYADENVSPCADENVSPYADENVSPNADENARPDSVGSSHEMEGINDNSESDHSLEMFDDDGLLLKPDNVNSDGDVCSGSDSSSESEMKKKGNVSLSIFRAEESRSELHKRALQPLTQAEVDKRSPFVMRDGKRIISEEIMISPDCNQPLIGLETSFSKPVRKPSTPPSRPSSCRKLRLSGNSPKNTNASAASSISGSAGRSPHAKSRVNLHNAFFQSSSPSIPANGSPSVSAHGNVLASDSPDSSAVRDLLSEENSPNASLNTSGARRSLAFGLDSSPQIFQRNGKTSRRIIDDSDDDTEVDRVDESRENSVQVIEDSLNHSDDEEGGYEEVEESDVEEENDEENEKFQTLVKLARAMYKRKDYEESLQCVEEALKIFQEPGLVEMAEKIRDRLQQPQE